MERSILSGVSNYLPALDHAHDDYHQRQHKQHMDEPAEGVAAHQAKRPQQHENDGNSFQHILTPQFQDGKRKKAPSGR
jgi:cephalosporin hydroxylase